MNDEVKINDDERVDSLRVQKMQIIQKEGQFSFSVDAVLLAHFAMLKQAASVADLGTGTGIIALLMAWRGAKKVAAVEINPIMAEVAARSVKLNSLENTISIHNIDIKDVREHFPSGGCDLVVSNPPYRQVKEGEQSQNDFLAMARHEVRATLEDVVSAAKYLLKFRGRFAMVHLPERLTDIMTAMRAASIEPKRLRMVHGSRDKRPGMVLIEGVSGGSAGNLIVEPPLFIYGDDGSYTPEVLQYYY